MQPKKTIAQLQAFYLFAFSGLTGIIRRPFYWRDALEQMEYSGAGTVGIVMLLSLFIGMAFSLQVSTELATLGLRMYTGRIVGISVISEISPVLAAVIYAGRAGSGMASELGSMRLGNQIDMLRVFGVDPLKKLVTPRLLCSLIMLPALTIIGDATALAGGYYIEVIAGHQSWLVYWDSIQFTFIGRFLLPGFLKPFVFGLIISSISAYAGFSSTGGAEGIKRSTTGAFVSSVILIIVTDFLVTKLTLIALGS